jgi:hypothetical protein
VVYTEINGFFTTKINLFRKNETKNWALLKKVDYISKCLVKGMEKIINFPKGEELVMIKTIKKASYIALALGALAVPGTSHAAGDAIIGTQAAGQISGGGSSATSGLAGGVMNLYYQGKLSNTTAFTAKFMNDSGLSVYGGAYKSYFGDGSYANAPYWALGLSIWDFAGLASATTVDASVGYDFTVSSKLVMGLDATYVYSLDTGGSITSLGLNVGYMF